MASRNTSRGLLLWSSRGRICGLVLLVFNSLFLVRLKFVAPNAFTQGCVVFTAVLREGKFGALDVGVDVVVADLVSFTIASNVICDVGP